METTPTTKTDPARTEAMVRAIIQGLSLRALMFVVLVGAFALAWRAMGDQSYLSLGVLGVYCGLGILPLAYLEIRRSHQP